MKRSMLFVLAFVSSVSGQTLQQQATQAQADCLTDHLVALGAQTMAAAAYANADAKIDSVTDRYNAIKNNATQADRAAIESHLANAALMQNSSSQCQSSGYEDILTGEGNEVFGGNAYRASQWANAIYWYGQASLYFDYALQAYVSGTWFSNQAFDAAVAAGVIVKKYE